MYVMKALPTNPRHKNFSWNRATIGNAGNIIYMELGEYRKPERKGKRRRKPKDPNMKDVRGVRKELLEYHYGIYRMFPCGKQHRYHMQYIHVPGVTDRNIR